MFLLEVVGLFVLLAGFIIGLGAVIVIDIHGFLGRKSAYWTEATIRTHKVNKPLIWVGILLVTIGAAITYRHNLLSSIPLAQAIIIAILILNGIFFSYKVSPYLLQQEQEGNAGKLLPTSLQRKIAIGLIVSDIGWWASVCLLVFHLVN